MTCDDQDCRSVDAIVTEMDVLVACGTARRDLSSVPWLSVSSLNWLTVDERDRMRRLCEELMTCDEQDG